MPMGKFLRVKWSGPGAKVAAILTDTHVEFVPERPVNAWRVDRAQAVALAHEVLTHFEPDHKTKESPFPKSVGPN